MKRLFTFLLFSCLTYSAFAVNIYWVGSSDNMNPGLWSDPANWSATAGGTGGVSAPTTSGSPAYCDVFFTQNAAVTFGSAVTGVCSITVNGGATVRFMSATTLVHFGTLTPTLSVTAGSKLELASSAGSGTSGGPTVNIAGTCNIAGTVDCMGGGGAKLSQAFSASNIINVTGTLRFGNISIAGTAADCGSPSLSGTLNMNAGSNMIMARTVVTQIPFATWNATSTLTINDLSLVTSYSSMSWGGSAAISLGNFVWDCPSQLAAAGTGFHSSTLSKVITVQGNTTFVNSNGQTIVNASGNSNSLTTTFKGNFTVSTAAQIDILTSNPSPASGSGSPTWIFEKNVSIAGPLTIGNVANTGTYTLQFTGSNTGLVGSGAQTFSCGALTAGKINLIVNNAGNGVTLGSNIGVLKNITCTSGKITLGANNLIAAGTISGSAGGGWVITDGTGKLTLQGVGTGGKKFAVGSSATSYDEVDITNTAGTNDYSVSVRDASAGFTKLVNDITKTCKREWDITSASTGATVEFNPGAGAACPGTLNVIGHYVGTAWTETPVIVGGGPFNGFPAATFTSFSPFGSGQAGGFLAPPLAVELKKVTAYGKGNTNIVEWATANEKNMQEYVVERSADGVNAWEVIGKQAATNAIDAKYDMQDATAAALSFYRVKSVELGGKENMSKIVSVKRETKGKLNINRIYPMPTAEVASVEFEATAIGKVQATVTDIVGRVVSTQNVEALQGLNRLSLNLNGLPQGAYILTLKENAAFVTQRIVKQ
jgi:hypothetical protein